ncbi:MAG: DUF4388 domain-containing protein, partial [Acidobacteria bacterium]
MDGTTMTAAESGRGLRLPAEGRLEGTSVAEVVWAAACAGHTGSLIFSRGGIQKVIYLRDGRVVFAASGDPEDRLGTFLLRRGEVELKPLLEASGKIARGRRLGQILVENEVLDRDRLVRAILDQVHEIALSVFTWNEGTWKVSRVGLAEDEPVLLEMPAEELILAGVRRVRDWSRVRRAVGGPRAVYRIAPGGRREGVRLTLTEKAILDQLSRPERVETLCREIYAPSFDVYRSLWALAVLGFVERVDAKLAPATGETGGTIDRFDDTARLLLDLGERRFTGVVRFYDGEREGALFLRDGKVEFATSNNPELSLMAHLVRRGVIADRDHEDAVRRLISGKRVGELLAERGAIDAKEIDRFVREQILEVAKFVVLWSSGEYRVEEELPSREPVVLDMNPEELILAAMEGWWRFEPVWERVGGLDALYRLAPGYLKRLDRLQLRPAVWEIVSLLSEERTVGELLDARPESDFEICKLLAGLALVGVIERVSQEEILARARRQPPARVVPPPPAPGPDELLRREPERETTARPARAAEIAPELFGPLEGRISAPPSLEEPAEGEPGGEPLAEAGGGAAGAMGETAGVPPATPEPGGTDGHPAEAWPAAAASQSFELDIEETSPELAEPGAEARHEEDAAGETSQAATGWEPASEGSAGAAPDAGAAGFAGAAPGTPAEEAAGGSGSVTAGSAGARWEIGGSEEGPVPAEPEGEVSGPAAEESAEEAGPEGTGAPWEIGGSEEGPVPAEPEGEVSGPAAEE